MNANIAEELQRTLLELSRLRNFQAATIKVGSLEAFSAALSRSGVFC